MEDLVATRRWLRAIELRYVLTWYLRELGPLTVAELARLVDDSGFRLRGRASKAISDALRWEIGHGRVIRLGRGRYGPGRVPRGTAYRIDRRVERILAGEVTSPWGY